MTAERTETAWLAGGCFWGMQELVRRLPGVLSTRVGYSGGDVPNATYRHHGSHAEALEVVFDPARLSWRELLEFFFQIHDPTTPNRQGNDRGSSYRSAIFFHTPEQERVARDTIADVEASGIWPGQVVTEVAPATAFWEAEPEHQDYLQRYPGGYTCHYPRPHWRLPRRSGGSGSGSGGIAPAAPVAELLTWDGVMDLLRHGQPAPPARVERSEAEWREQLTPAQFQITRLKATERPGSSDMCRLFEPGRYRCVCCGTELFDATTKYDSRSGWPSFTQAIAPGRVAYVGDESHGMWRVETTCAVCDAHLGHEFPDGPAPSGLRYSINALALEKA